MTNRDREKHDREQERRRFASLVLAGIMSRDPRAVTVAAVSVAIEAATVLQAELDRTKP